jgi:hypothetical protein
VDTEPSELNWRDKLAVALGALMVLIGLLALRDSSSRADAMQIGSWTLALAGVAIIREKLMLVIREVEHFVPIVACVAGFVIAIAIINNNQADTFFQVACVGMLFLWVALGLVMHFFTPLGEYWDKTAAQRKAEEEAEPTT